MTVSAATTTQRAILAAILAELTGSPASELTMGRAQLLAAILAELTGSPASHRHIGRAELERRVIAAFASERNISFAGATTTKADMWAGYLNALQEGGGPSPYIAQAVHSAGSVYLSIASMVGPVTTGKFSCAVWIKIPLSEAENPSIELFVPGGGILGNFYWDFPLDFNLRDGYGGSDYRSVSNGAVITAGEWIWLGFSVDAGHPSGERISVAYQNDVDLQISPVNDGTDAGIDPITTAISGHSMTVLSSGSTSPLDCADFIMWVDQQIDFSVEANRRKFIDASGKPVDPAGAVAEFGAPICLFSGNSSTFATNQGSGGAFTLTGSLTNAGTSPSD